jgi:predicted DNA-binding ArsR family transcriptional regulator
MSPQRTIGSQVPPYSALSSVSSRWSAWPDVWEIIGPEGYRGLHVAESSGLLKGLTAEWQVLIDILAILAGLFVATIIVPRKATL